jgi:CDP-diacylglycerol--glycerol-3-phosphate 3-phosphatidyltransferase/cardiolipin synthase
MMRLDLLIASFARRTLWLTDAYFMGTSTYLSALKQAARDGVDVRLLVPRSSDIRWIATVSRTMYRPLLESGVRVFEWNGPMIHAKTAVADGRWARIGSTNLNISSWLANREIDVAIEDESVAGELAARFLQDLEQSTEVVLSGHKRTPVLTHPRQRQQASFLFPNAGHAARSGASAAARQAARIGDALGAVVRGTRSIDSSEATAFSPSA